MSVLRRTPAARRRKIERASDRAHQRLARYVAAGFRALNAAGLELGAAEAASPPALRAVLRRRMRPRKPKKRR